MINIVKHSKIWFFVSGALVLASIIALLKFGLKPGIDFTGGSLLEVKFKNRPDISQVQEALSGMNLGSVTTQPIESDKMVMRMRFITETEHQDILVKLREKFGAGEEVATEVLTATASAEETKNEKLKVESISGNVADIKFELPTENDKKDDSVVKTVVQNSVPSVSEERFETIGPAVSATIREKSIYTALAVILSVVACIAYSFRKVSKPIKSWKYGVAAVVALLHDIIITMGVFALLGEYKGVDVGIPFVVAILTILGYSVNNTIVVFDRIRENLIKRGTDNFDETVNIGIVESIARTFNTSFTTLLSLVAIYFFGGSSIQYFSLALIVGMIFGTYSCIFLASPLLLEWNRFSKK